MGHHEVTARILQQGIFANRVKRNYNACLGTTVNTRWVREMLTKKSEAADPKRLSRRIPMCKETPQGVNNNTAKELVKIRIRNMILDWFRHYVEHLACRGEPY